MRGNLIALAVILAVVASVFALRGQREVDSSFREVSRLQRPAHLAMLDANGLSILDVTQTSKPLAVPLLQPLVSSCPLVASAEGHTVLAASKDRIYEIRADGSSTTWPARPHASPDWLLEVGNGGVFTVFNHDSIARIRRKGEGVDTVRAPFPVGADVDPDTAMVYVPRDNERTGIVIAGLDTRVEVFHATRRPYEMCNVGSGDRLLLSFFLKEKNGPIAVYDIKSKQETDLPIQGFEAIWGPDGAIFFRRDNALFRYDGTREERLAEVPGLRKTPPPVISRDGTLVAWSGLAIDLTTREYLRLPKPYNSYAWLR